MLTQESKAIGTLIMAGNSLGNPDDIPPRSLQALRESDLVIFEEDRPARQTLKAAKITRSYLKVNEHSRKETLVDIRAALESGQSVCYMSDQGMPTLADPGRALLILAHEVGAKVSVIPGPSSITAALAVCPFLTTGFVFRNFLSKDESKRRLELVEISESQFPSVILETPYRRQSLLDQCVQALDPFRNVLLALDISGPEEQFISGPLRVIANKSKAVEGKLNFVLIIDGRNYSPDNGAKKPRL